MPKNSTTTTDVLDTLDNSTVAAVLNKKQNYDDNFISHCCVALIRTVSTASSSLFAASSSMWLPHLWYDGAHSRRSTSPSSCNATYRVLLLLTMQYGASSFSWWCTMPSLSIVCGREGGSVLGIHMMDRMMVCGGWQYSWMRFKGEFDGGEFKMLHQVR